MSPEEIIQAVRGFAKSALSLTDSQVIVYQGPGVRPASAYCSVQFVGDESTGIAESTTVGTPGNLSVRVSDHRRCQVSVQTYGASADAWASSLAVMWASRHAAADVARTAGLHPARATGPRDTTVLTDTSHEPRRQVTLYGYHRTTIADDPSLGYVSQIDVALDMPPTTITASSTEVP